MRRPSSPRRSLGRLAAAAALTLALGAPGAARAQSPDEINIARQTAVEGLGAYKTGEYTKALRLFEEAKAIYPSAQILRMWGYSLLALDRWEQAADAMESALESKVGPLTDKDRADVNEQRGKAAAHLAMVNVTSKIAGAEVRIDDKPPQKLPLEKPVRLLEGKHAFVVHAEDHVDASQEVTIPGGKPFELALEPAEREKAAPPPPPPPPPKPAPPERTGLFPHQSAVGFMSVGAGVVLGGAALTAALVGAHLRSNVANDVALHDASYPAGCTGASYRLCSFDAEVVNADADRADHLRNASIWMGIGAGVLVAGGAALVYFAPSEKRTAAVPTTGSLSPRHVACGPNPGGPASKPWTGAGLFCTGAF